MQVRERCEGCLRAKGRVVRSRSAPSCCVKCQVSTVAVVLCTVDASPADVLFWPLMHQFLVLEAFKWKWGVVGRTRFTPSVSPAVVRVQKGEEEKLRLAGDVIDLIKLKYDGSDDV